MAKTPEVALRHIQLLKKIPKHPGKVDLRTIQDYLLGLGYDIDDRTVQRDLVALSSIFPLVCDDSSRPHGWSFSSSTNSTHLPAMGVNEALTLLLTDKFLESHLPPALRRHLKPQLKDAEHQLRLFNKRAMSGWLKKIAHLPRGFQLKPADIQPRILDIVYDALLDDKQIEITYSGKAEQLINPLGIVLRDQVIYLVCTYWEYPELRYISLHRISKAKLLDSRVIKPKEFSLQAYIDEGHFGVLNTDKHINIKIKFTREAAHHLSETPLADNQIMKDVDDTHTIVEGTVNDTSELRWWLRAFGNQVEVLKPASLRAEFKKMAQNMSALYSD